MLNSKSPMTKKSGEKKYNCDTNNIVCFSLQQIHIILENISTK